MATTTNYGWTTPDDTALVKDGASAIRTLGSSVDTTTKNLNPSTTLGDIEYRSSTANTNTRLGIGTSGQALTVVAGAPSWAASPTSVLTTTGDSLYASAANTLARLGIGSTGQVLTVAAGLPSWATPAAGGGMTLLSTTTLSGSSVTVSSISQSYRNLFVEVFGCTWDTSNDAWTFATNLGSVNSSKKVGATGIVSPQTLVTTINQINDGTDNILRTGGNNYVTFNFSNYASTTASKTCQIFGSAASGSSNGTPIILFVSIVSNTAINEFTFALAGSQNMTAGTIKIYGVN